MIVELKHNKSAESTIDQIKEKRYYDSLSQYQGNLLFVGINHDEGDKAHTCKVERFEKEAQVFLFYTLIMGQGVSVLPRFSIKSD